MMSNSSFIFKIYFSLYSAVCRPLKLLFYLFLEKRYAIFQKIKLNNPENPTILLYSKNKERNMKRKKALKKVYVTLTILAVYGLGFLSALYGEQTAYFVKSYFKDPKVSVVMSTYNRAEALPIAIDSILNQTMPDFEFIIVDDGSTDDTAKVIQKYAQKDRRIVFLKNEENKGLIYSLNRGLDNARGQYIARMDDDDKSVPFRFERQIEAMDAHPEITVLGTSIIGKETVPVKKETAPQINNPQEVELDTYFSSGLAHPTIMIRRDFLEKNKIRYDKEYLYAEDCGLYKDILNKGGKVSSISEGLLHFGYVNGLDHPEKYSEIQGETFKKIQKEKFSFFFDAPYEMLGAFKGTYNACLILKKMQPINDEKKILDQEVIEKRIGRLCPPDMGKAYLVKHPYWEAYVMFDSKTKFHRTDVPEETGTVIKETPTTMTFKWKNWPGTEVYEKSKNKHLIYQKDGDGLKKDLKSLNLK